MTEIPPLSLDPFIHFSFPRLLGIWVVIYSAWKYIEAKRSPLKIIPAVGYSGVLTSYITVLRIFWNGREVLQEGYDKYSGQPFRVPTISGWTVVIGRAQLVEEVRKAPDDALSNRQAIAERLQTRYTLGLSVDDIPYHIAAVRSPLTRSLTSRFPEVRDEIVESFKDYIPLTEDWTTIPTYETFMHIVCRTSDRYFVGLPLCRDPGYRSLNETFTFDVAFSASVINCFPNFLKPLVGRCLTTLPKSMKRALEFLGPTLEERLAQEKQYGAAWAKRPNDLITWLLEQPTQDCHRTVRDLVLRILTINFAAIHTSTMTLTQLIYDLAIHPEYVNAMREEAESIIAEGGWTKAAMQRMRKVDSFLKESQRLNSGEIMAMNRKVLRNWTLSDGTLLPAGTTIGVASDAVNKDEQSFPDAHTFKGFRFAEVRAGDGEFDSIKHQMVSLNPNYIVFGYGRHVCPGRFFAVYEIKAMFAHILLNYDVQLVNGSMKRPVNFSVGTSVLPNMKAKIMFRKRRV